MNDFKLFQKLLVGIFFVFMSIMGTVLFKAYSKTSGSTGLSMSKIHEIRLNAYK